jgi:hypothetical protein
MRIHSWKQLYIHTCIAHNGQHKTSTGIFIISDYTFYSEAFYNKGSPLSKVKTDAHHILLLFYFYQALLYAAVYLKTYHYVMFLAALYDFFSHRHKFRQQFTYQMKNLNKKK